MHAFYLVWVFCASAELFRRAPVVVAIDLRLTPRMKLLDDISACRLCALRFAATHTAHEPRPIVWLNSSARILIAGQAPGMRVYESGVPFDDRSGERLRNWLGLTPEQFYNKNEVAIVPMAFCFPGYDAQTNDLPPPTICSETWHDKVMEMLPAVKLRIVLGKSAQSYHLGSQHSVTETVRTWRDMAPEVFPLPHPSWRNTGWLKKNPWFEAELLPELRAAVKEVLA